MSVPWPYVVVEIMAPSCGKKTKLPLLPILLVQLVALIFSLLLTPIGKMAIAHMSLIMVADNLASMSSNV